MSYRADADSAAKLFLGNYPGVPTKTRNVSGIALRESKGKCWYLIAYGEGKGTQHQVLHTKLSFHSLKDILITHVHGDHCYGLPGCRASWRVRAWALAYAPLGMVSSQRETSVLVAALISTIILKGTSSLATLR